MWLQTLLIPARGGSSWGSHSGHLGCRGISPKPWRSAAQAYALLSPRGLQHTFPGPEQIPKVTGDPPWAIRQASFWGQDKS